MDNLFIKTKEKLDHLLPYWLPSKLLISLLITSLGSASFLGFISEYAVYNYAVHLGFRVPIEGIPYLKLAVTLISLLLFGVAILGFILIYIFAKSTAMSFNIFEYLMVKSLYFILRNKEKPVIKNALRDASNLRVIIISTLASIVVTTIIHFNIIANDKSNSQLFIFSFDLSMFLAASIIYTSTFKPNLIKYISMISGFVCICILLTSMFNTNIYSRFLYITGFGGERKTTLYINDSDKTISGSLLIKSNDYYFILNNNEIQEFPVKEVKKIAYEKANFISKT